MGELQKATLPESVLTDAVMALLRGSELGVAVFDDADILRFANESFTRMFHQHPDGRSTWLDLMRANHAQRRGSVVSGDADFEDWLAAAHSRRGQQSFRAFEGDLIDGRWIWMTETMLASGWMLSVAADITEFHQDARTLRRARDRALRAAQIDALTGISNRTFVMRRFEQLLRAPGPLAVAVFDLDHFKHINDRYGHPVGDEVIRDFARLLQAGIRRADCCGRVGGEEFLLLLPGCELAQASAIIERLMQRVRLSTPVPLAPHEHYSVSAGLALRQPGEDVTRLYQRADDALYQAKREGRDRLVCAPPPGAALA